MGLQVPPKLMSLQSCTELLEARDTSGSPDDEKTRVTTANIAMHAMATAPIRITRVLFSGKCVASMACFRLLIRLQRTTTRIARTETCFSLRDAFGGVARRGQAAGAAAARQPNIAVALHRRERLSEKTTKVLFYLYSDLHKFAGNFFVVWSRFGLWPLFHH